MATPTTNRDQALKIACWFLQSIFAWIHKPWSTTESTLVERLVDAIIAAAADQARTVSDGAVLLDELLAETPQRPAHPGSAKTVNYRRDADDDPNYVAWKQRNARSDVQGILRREGR